MGGFGLFRWCPATCLQRIWPSVDLVRHFFFGYICMALGLDVDVFACFFLNFWYKHTGLGSELIWIVSGGAEAQI
jgi:hypothetical protein